MSTFADPQAEAALTELQRALKTNARARALLDQFVSRLAYVARLGRQWDATHAQQAETYLRLGQLDKASSAAMNVFDADLKHDLLKRMHAAALRPAQDGTAPAAAAASASEPDDDWLFAEMHEREVLA